MASKMVDILNILLPNGELTLPLFEILHVQGSGRNSK